MTVFTVTCIYRRETLIVSSIWQKGQVLLSHFLCVVFRVEGELLHWTAVQRWLQPPPNWTICMGSKPGGAGSNSTTSNHKNVSQSSLSCSPLIFRCRFLSHINQLCSILRCLCFTLSPVHLKEDILQCDSAELSFALSCFIKEVRRPNGDTYSPDSIFYLCLGIQQVHTSTNILAFFFVFQVSPHSSDSFFSCFPVSLNSFCLWRAA